MDPITLGRRYDKIASWWQSRHDQSQYGLRQLERALTFCDGPGRVLDVGCGCGGRFLRLLEERGDDITGIDVSAEMIRLAREAHPQADFMVQDVCNFKSTRRFDLIIAWDSIFHLPLNRQRAVVAGLCRLLAPAGVLIYSFGDASEGEHVSEWHNDSFHYSTIGIDGNLRVLSENGVACKHLELDQWPENHAYLIGIKAGSHDS